MDIIASVFVPKKVYKPYLLKLGDYYTVDMLVERNLISDKNIVQKFAAVHYIFI